MSSVFVLFTIGKMKNEAEVMKNFLFLLLGYYLRRERKKWNNI